MRKQGSYEYKEDAEEAVLQCVGTIPATTNAITNNAKKYFGKIHHRTVRRLLHSLYAKGKVKKMIVGRIELWQK